MAVGDNVFSPLGISPSQSPSTISVLGINDVLLHALIVRLALSSNDVVEFQTEYDKATDTVELAFPNEALPFFNQLLGMQRGPRLTTFINWLIGSETLVGGSSLEDDPAYISASSMTAWAGATVGNMEDRTLVWLLPSSCLSTLGYNTKASEDFAGGSLKVTLFWVYDSGSQTSFDIQTSAMVTDIATGNSAETVNEESIPTTNLIKGDVRETVILETVAGIAADDLVNIVIRRNWDTTTDPAIDLVGIIGIKVELIPSV